LRSSLVVFLTGKRKCEYAQHYCGENCMFH
jgi:hypothetical protein